MSKAQIIAHPRAAIEKVIQTRIRGRLPKSIISIGGYPGFCRRRAKEQDKVDRETVAQEIIDIQFQLEVNQRMRASWLYRLAELTQANTSAKGRKAMADEIRRENLSVPSFDKAG